MCCAVAPSVQRTSCLTWPCTQQPSAHMATCVLQPQNLQACQGLLQFFDDRIWAPNEHPRRDRQMCHIHKYRQMPCARAKKLNSKLSSKEGKENGTTLSAACRAQFCRKSFCGGGVVFATSIFILVPGSILQGLFGLFVRSI